MSRELKPDPVPDEILVRSNRNTADRVIHIPADDDGHEALCSHFERVQPEKQHRKSIDTYPPAWREWCYHCVRKHNGLQRRRWGGD